MECLTLCVVDMTAVVGVVSLAISDLTPGLRDRLRVLRAVAPGLVGRDHHVGRHEERSVLGWRHHVVRLVPDPVVELQHGGAQAGLLCHVAQGGLGVTFHLSYRQFILVTAILPT